MKYKLTRRGLSLLVVVAVLAAIGCCTMIGIGHKGDEEQLKSIADSFSVSYFNWRFPDALRFCTSSSRKWLSFAASGVTEDDVEALRNKEEGASCHFEQLDYGTNDSTAWVTMRVSNFLSMDSIGKTPRVVEEAYYKIPMVYVQGRWLVNLTELPRHERLPR